jgi:hypothetical protein
MKELLFILYAILCILALVLQLYADVLAQVLVKHGVFYKHLGH